MADRPQLFEFAGSPREVLDWLEHLRGRDDVHILVVGSLAQALSTHGARPFEGLRSAARDWWNPGREVERARFAAPDFGGVIVVASGPGAILRGYGMKGGALQPSRSEAATDVSPEARLWWHEWRSTLMPHDADVLLWELLPQALQAAHQGQLEVFSTERFRDPAAQADSRGTLFMAVGFARTAPVVEFRLLPELAPAEFKLAAAERPTGFSTPFVQGGLLTDSTLRAAFKLIGDQKADEHSAGTNAGTIKEFVATEQDNRNAKARLTFLSTYAQFTEAEVDAGARRHADSETQTARQWRDGGHVFAVTAQDELLFPAFQFANGLPRPEVREAVREFRSRDASDWDLALWFGNQDPLLRACPAELLDDNPDDVTVAAHRVFETPV